MSLLLLRNARLLDPEASDAAPGALLLDGERIRARLHPGEEPPAGSQAVDLAGAYLAPGLLDVHVHGSLVFARTEALEPALRQDAARQLRSGVTGFLATTVAWPRDALRERVTALARAMTHFDAPGARPLGIHLEGPWIRAEACGAQPRQAIRPYDAVEGREVLERGEGWVRLVTLAPEASGAWDLVSELARRSIAAALGHSLATAEQVGEAAARGVSHATHLFNAMGPLHQRAPGPAAAVLAEPRLSCDLICDGAHVHPAWVRIAARVKGRDLILITDRLDLPRDSDFGSGPLRDDGTALRLPDGRLAGSRLTLDRAIQNVRSWGALDLHGAVVACTLRPARLLGIEAECGTLRPGARADLVVLEEDGSVRETWLGGRRVTS